MERETFDYFKYMIQDTGHIYIGARYSYRELMESPETNYKFKAIMEQYLFKEADPDTTLESDFYYMKKDSFEYRTYEQLKVRCKINILTDKKSIFGARRQTYTEKTLTLEQLVDMSLAVKKRDGVMIQEIIFSKLALMSFVV